MKHAIILGAGSDIGRQIAERLRTDGWMVTGVRHDQALPPRPWDLIICCYGVLDPIGSFFAAHGKNWEAAFEVNLFLPLRQVRYLYQYRRPGASVCFFSGAGANGPAPTYSAYCVSKIALVKAVECLDAESEDCKFFILGPGMVRTKIQEQTLAAGDRAANYRRVADFMVVTDDNDSRESHDRIYACLMACAAAPKAAVGGRNIYVPLDDWTRLNELADQPDAFKLRRANDGGLRRNTSEVAGDLSTRKDYPR